MKKLGLGVIGIILVAAIYYFTAGSAQLTEEMKIRVNTELTMIEQNGFKVQDREIKEKEEHFVLSFNDPEKIVHFLKQQGTDITLEEAQAFQGIKVGVDLKYLNDAYSAVSAELYPLNLPPAITEQTELTEEDKLFIAQLNAMLERKALLVHVDFNKLLSSFKGHIKDVNETFKMEEEINLALKGATFEGAIKDDKITDLTQNINLMYLKMSTVLNVSLSKMSSTYKVGNTAYASSSTYTMANVTIAGSFNEEAFLITAHDIDSSTEISVKNDLISSTIHFNVANLEMSEGTQKVKVQNSTFALNIGNLDLNILKKIEAADVNDEALLNTLMQELIAKEIYINIPNFEVKKIEYLGENLEGFSLNSQFKINKSANLAQIELNPFAAMNAVNTKTKIILSPELFMLIAQDPRAMMLTMLIQPQELNGKKVYDVELKDGKLLVNGKPMM